MIVTMRHRCRSCGEDYDCEDCRPSTGTAARNADRTGVGADHHVYVRLPGQKRVGNYHPNDVEPKQGM